MKTNTLASKICTEENKYNFLDSNNILWKWVNDEWIGKRSVYTFDLRACWLEDTTIDKVRSFWCGGKDADYNEIYKKD